MEIIDVGTIVCIDHAYIEGFLITKGNPSFVLGLMQPLH